MSVHVGFKIGKASERKAYISEYYCGECGWPVSDHDSYCPECGGAFRKEDATERTCNMTLKKSGPYYDVWYFDCCNKEWSEARCDNGVSDYPGIVCPYGGAKVVGE